MHFPYRTEYTLAVNAEDNPTINVSATKNSDCEWKVTVQPQGSQSFKKSP